MEDMARLLIVGGVILLLVGILILVFSKLGGGFRLPGDIYYHRGNFTLYFPIVTCIVLSLVLTIILNFFWRH